MPKIKKVFNCNVELTIDVIKNKWTPIIIIEIGNAEVIRYGELKREIPNINERVLVRQLRELEKRKLIKRKVYDEVPPKVEYSLTEIGKTLVPILDELGEWGKKYNKHTNYGEIELKHGCQ
ncbi:winged helix-turn-helix transcriptional regulator [Clostridium perfringens]|uniref:winged helix-turn-helix transcriptional regulator n=1 Tax=Clostridium perfringens TaxID=1502 RepID=UPI0018E404D0|nr:helix-turn-helix domain-containing protein [Clostridium perfringens]MBI6106789.1 helix-turn-helix transcriptional regulator [Clostridium perfringens]